MNLTSKQRSKLKGIAQNTETLFQIGKDSVTPQLCAALREALETRELIKIHVLKNCDDDKHELAETIAGRTQSTVVQIIGNKIVLFKYQKDAGKRKIELN